MKKDKIICDRCNQELNDAWGKRRAKEQKAEYDYDKNTRSFYRAWTKERNRIDKIYLKEIKPFTKLRDKQLAQAEKEHLASLKVKQNV